MYIEKNVWPLFRTLWGSTKMGKSNYMYNIEHKVTGIGKMRKINEDEFKLDII